MYWGLIPTYNLPFFQITFKTKIYHPNIDEKGQVCLPIISPENWKPATKTDQGLYRVDVKFRQFSLFIGKQPFFKLQLVQLGTTLWWKLVLTNKSVNCKNSQFVVIILCQILGPEISDYEHYRVCKLHTLMYLPIYPFYLHDLSLNSSSALCVWMWISDKKLVLYMYQHNKWWVCLV